MLASLPPENFDSERSSQQEEQILDPPASVARHRVTPRAAATSAYQAVHKFLRFGGKERGTLDGSTSQFHMRGRASTPATLPPRLELRLAIRQITASALGIGAASPSGCSPRN